MPISDVLAARVRKKKSPTTRQTHLQEKEAQLSRDIDALTAVINLYLPGAAAWQAQLDTQRNPASKPPRAQDRQVWLPSAIPLASRSGTWCFHAADVKERILRIAQMDDTIVELRTLLRTQQGTLIRFDRDVKNTGQRLVTRALGTLKNMQCRITRVVQRYRAARNAMTSLDPGGPWTLTYQKLEDWHVRGPCWEKNPQDEERHRQRDARREPYLQRQSRSGKESQGRFVSSWIWFVKTHVNATGAHRSGCPLARKPQSSAPSVGAATERSTLEASQPSHCTLAQNTDHSANLPDLRCLDA